MGLFSFLQGRSDADGDRAAADPVQVARARARRRLIGAAVLLGIGVVGFPLLFETQPRPVAVDIPIEIPRKDAAPALPLPPPRAPSAAAARVSGGAVGAEQSPEASRAAGSAPAATTAAAKPAAKPEPKPEARAEPKAEAKAEPAKPESAKSEPKLQPAKPAPAAAPSKGDDGARARALLEGQAASAVPSAAGAQAAGNGRFVVQVGSFGEAKAAHDMRQKLDKLGLKSYTQVVQIGGARRIRVRVGPFAARDEAEHAAGKLKAAGMQAAVMTL
ncbi:MAG: SPOR domain-containing protein [Ideonella sp.]|nr:SPOR domain-containing protein [Ideonella sp.]MCC7458313.1 SPOR domain-containing protein [Nitrospira sp.]